MPLSIEIDIERLQVLKVIFGFILLFTLLLSQFVWFHLSFIRQFLLTLSLVCLVFPILARILHFTGYGNKKEH